MSRGSFALHTTPSPVRGRLRHSLAPHERASFPAGYAARNGLPRKLINDRVGTGERCRSQRSKVFPLYFVLFCSLVLPSAAFANRVKTVRGRTRSARDARQRRGRHNAVSTVVPNNVDRFVESWDRGREYVNVVRTERSCRRQGSRVDDHSHVWLYVPATRTGTIVAVSVPW